MASIPESRTRSTNSSALRPCEPASASVPKTTFRPGIFAARRTMSWSSSTALFHRRETFCSVLLRADEAVIFSHIIMEHESGLRIEIGAACDKKFKRIVVRRHGSVLDLECNRPTRRRALHPYKRERVRNPCLFATSQAALSCSCQSDMPPPLADRFRGENFDQICARRFLLAHETHESHRRASFSPLALEGLRTAVRMRGPGIAPLAIASRSGTSVGEPTLCTVVKPAIECAPRIRPRT